MKRFWKDVTVGNTAAGWQVMLDGRGIRTQGGSPQIVPSAALAELLAGEWRAQGDEVDLRGFFFRDMADLAIDIVLADRAATLANLARFSQSDTLCYRAEPDEPLFARQEQLWEPLVTACEARHDVTFVRISGIMHQPQPPATVAALHRHLDGLDHFTLAALQTLTSLTASLITGLAALERDAEATDLFAAANAEEDWQAELWGWDFEAEETRALRMQAFAKALEFVRAARA